ncbi:hypothetical protein P7K49_032694 [Saguinus oedipus]|uniref:Uncharacterized protein n=1 Tax=Saguinus oedipus TaxID=9490 RepID=A0ABQ9TPT1_SAGOE|nr:hypothetical protein P7K49_032694 [Saguinus oedipus]
MAEASPQPGRYFCHCCSVEIVPRLPRRPRVDRRGAGAVRVRTPSCTCGKLRPGRGEAGPSRGGAAGSGDPTSVAFSIREAAGTPGGIRPPNPVNLGIAQGRDPENNARGPSPSAQSGAPQARLVEPWPPPGSSRHHPGVRPRPAGGAL